MPPETSTLPVAPASPGDLSARLKHLDQLVSRAGALGDPTTRTLVQDLLRELLELHGLGLQRIFALLEDRGDATADDAREELFSDKTVRGLLLMHDLHPQSLEERIDQALVRVQPYLRSHGAEIELLALDGGVARLRLSGTSRSPTASRPTLERSVRAVLDEFCPDLTGLQIESPQLPSPVQVAERVHYSNTFHSGTATPVRQLTR